MKVGTKTGLVRIAGNLNDKMPKGTVNNVLKQSRQKYGSEECAQVSIVIQRAENNYSACSLDLLGRRHRCDRSADPFVRNVIKFHLEGLKEDQYTSVSDVSNVRSSA